MRIAFYSPMKPLDHPVPSGERLMARQLFAVLAHLGHEVVEASHLRTFSHEPSEHLRGERWRDATGERDRLSRLYRAENAPWRPDVWFSYHPYYKAPDLIGPEVAATLRIPYLTAEASYAPKRDRDAWSAWQQPLVAALRAAACNICMTRRDREQIERLPGRVGQLVDLAPFLIAQPVVEPVAVPCRRFDAVAPVALVTVAMMRYGDKLDSYRVLADALRRLRHRDWTLTIVGDGEARSDVALLFADFDLGRIDWRGQLTPEAVGQSLATGQVFVWPGVGEAYGLAYLEAAARGLPAVALDTAGVPAVVVHERTGLLAPDRGVPDRGTAFAAALDRMLIDAPLRQKLGAAAAVFVRDERSLRSAAAILAETLELLEATEPDR